MSDLNTSEASMSGPAFHRSNEQLSPANDQASGQIGLAVSDETGSERTFPQSDDNLATGQLVAGVTIDGLRVLVQNAGYRVDTLTGDGVSFLRSATGGLPFDIRLGTLIEGTAGAHGDLTFVMMFSIKGSLSLEMVNQWNRSRRFARLFIDQAAGGEFLVLCMDVTLLGGVTLHSLHAQISVWDALAQQLVSWLRDETQRAGTAPAAAAEAAVEMEAQA